RGGKADVRNWTVSSNLQFFDFPRIDKSLNPNHLKTRFQTELVGVIENDDGTKTIRHTHLGFMWKSNTNYELEGGISDIRKVFFSNLEDPGSAPPIVAGGISDVSVFRPGAAA